MKTILLVCSAGMSTSLLVTKMEAAAKEQGVEGYSKLKKAELLEVLNK